MKLPSSLTTVTLFSKILAGILFFIFIVSGFFAGMKYQATIDLTKYQQSNLATPKPSPTPADQTANWQTYRNAEYGFKFKYPKDWVFKVSEDKRNKDLDINLANFQTSDFRYLCKKNDISLEIQSHKKDQNQDLGFLIRSAIAEEELHHDLGPSGSLEEIIIGGYLVYKVQNGGGEGFCPGPGYFIERDKSHYIYIFSGYGNQSESQDIVNQILSTFKFTDQNETVPTNVQGQSCGGIAGAICPTGYKCQLNGTYPDASGTCVKQ